MSTSWDRVTELFGAARLLDPAARAAFLAAACADDAALRAHVETLLRADVADGFLDTPPALTAALAEVHEHGVLRRGTLLNDRYEIDEPFGAGGHALVYLATDRVLARRVVVKVLRAAPLHASAIKLRFAQEMEALARLDHPAVVGILDVGELADRSPFLVIQYIDGMSVRQLLAAGPVDPAHAGRIIREIGAALRAAHAAGIAHRDLKPENIMVQRLAGGGEAIKLIDFGIAKIDRSELTADVTTVMIEGSVRYMAPEQFEGRNSPASDTYSLGLVACELLCGHPDPRALPKDTSGAVRRLVEAAVAFRPEDRPADVKAWADELTAALRRRPARMTGMRRWAIAGAVMIATALLGMSVVGEPGSADDRIVEKVGAYDPLTEGFQIHNEVAGTVVRTRDNTEFVGWSVSTSSPGGGYYYRRLSAEQKRRALAQGWTLSATMTAVEGGAFAVVDFGKSGRRFDINIIRLGGEDVIRLNTRIVPALQGLELRIPRAGDPFYMCELRFDAGLQTADLWVNGQQRLSGYRGHTEFQDDMGVLFGAAPFKGPRGVASFERVRFEIKP